MLIQKQSPRSFWFWVCFPCVLSSVCANPPCVPTVRRMGRTVDHIVKIGEVWVNKKGRYQPQDRWLMGLKIRCEWSIFVYQTPKINVRQRRAPHRSSWQNTLHTVRAGAHGQAVGTMALSSSCHAHIIMHRPIGGARWVLGCTDVHPLSCGKYIAYV